MTRHFKSFTLPSIEAFQNLIRSLLMVIIHIWSTRIASLVYSMRTENIDSVMCNGRWIMRGKKILTVDEVLFPFVCFVLINSGKQSCPVIQVVAWLKICLDFYKESVLIAAREAATQLLKRAKIEIPSRMVVVQVLMQCFCTLLNSNV